MVIAIIWKDNNVYILRADEPEQYLGDASVYNFFGPPSRLGQGITIRVPPCHCLP